MRTEHGSFVLIDVAFPGRTGIEVYEVNADGLELYRGLITPDRTMRVGDGPLRRAVMAHEAAKRRMARPRGPFFTDPQ